MPMTELPIACSLEADELRQRLRAIATVGADGLIESSTERSAHVLRFHSDASTRRRLEAIVAAEAKCCAFLDLDLRSEGDQLVLGIAAPSDGQPIADELALAFESRK
jgi:hypothetical protein